MRISIALAAVIVALPAYAQPAAPVPAADTSAFCQSGSVAAMTGAGSNRVLADTIWRSCKRGDVIQLPGAETYAISTMCDFSRAIVASGGKVMCVLLAKERATR